MPQLQLTADTSGSSVQCSSMLPRVLRCCRWLRAAPAAPNQPSLRPAARSRLRIFHAAQWTTRAPTRNKPITKSGIAARAGGKPHSPMRSLWAPHAPITQMTSLRALQARPLRLNTAPWAPGLEYRYRRYGLEKTGLVYTNSSPSRSWATRKSSSTYTHLVDDKRAGLFPVGFFQCLGLPLSSFGSFTPQ